MLYSPCNSGSQDQARLQTGGQVLNYTVFDQAFCVRPDSTQVPASGETSITYMIQILKLLLSVPREHTRMLDPGHILHAGSYEALLPHAIASCTSNGSRKSALLEASQTPCWYTAAKWSCFCPIQSNQVIAVAPCRGSTKPEADQQENPGTAPIPDLTGCR